MDNRQASLREKYADLPNKWYHNVVKAINVKPVSSCKGYRCDSEIVQHAVSVSEVYATKISAEKSATAPPFFHGNKTPHCTVLDTFVSINLVRPIPSNIFLCDPPKGRLVAKYSRPATRGADQLLQHQPPVASEGQTASPPAQHARSVRARKREGFQAVNFSGVTSGRHGRKRWGDGGGVP